MEKSISRVLTTNSNSNLFLEFLSLHYIIQYVGNNNNNMFIISYITRVIEKYKKITFSNPFNKVYEKNYIYVFFIFILIIVEKFIHFSYKIIYNNFYTFGEF